MKHAVVDKRIAGIIRWLERLKESYRSGAMETALMDAECARADLEDLRQDVWAKVMPGEVKAEIRERKIFRGFWAVIRPSLLALLIVMLMVVPLAKDVILTPPAEIPETIAQKIEQEEIILAEPVIIKEETLTTPTPAKKAAAPAKKATQLAKRAQVSTPKTPAVKTVPYDKVFSLVQTGQRALKNNNSVIRVP